MSFHLYKEGQGSWSRGILAALVFGTGMLAALRTFAFLDAESFGQTNVLPLPFLGFQLQLKALLSGLILIPFGVAGVWLYNHHRLADFLIDTESELKNKVTWPSRKEATNNSIVVVVTCILIGIWVLAADLVFAFVQGLIYGGPAAS